MQMQLENDTSSIKMPVLESCASDEEYARKLQMQSLVNVKDGNTPTISCISDENNVQESLKSSGGVYPEEQLRKQHSAGSINTCHETESLDKKIQV